jgi:hypothetical protein
MSYSGEAAEQVVRIGLQGTETALRISGKGAERLAVLVYTLIKDGQASAGKTRLTNMLQTGKELKVFSIKESDLRMFEKEAKRYGVMYCALREKRKDKDHDPESLVDVMVKLEDSAKMSRIVERMRLATVDVGEVVAEIDKDLGADAPDAPDKGVEQKDAAVKEEEAKAEKPTAPEQNAPENPTPAKTRTPKSNRSGRSSGSSKAPSRADTDSGKDASSRKSVRQELDRMKQERRDKAATPPQEKTRLRSGRKLRKTVKGRDRA